MLMSSRYYTCQHSTIGVSSTCPQWSLCCTIATPCRTTAATFGICCRRSWFTSWLINCMTSITFSIQWHHMHSMWFTISYQFITHHSTQYMYQARIET